MHLHTKFRRITNFFKNCIVFPKNNFFIYKVRVFFPKFTSPIYKAILIGNTNQKCNNLPKSRFNYKVITFRELSINYWFQYQKKTNPINSSILNKKNFSLHYPLCLETIKISCTISKSKATL